MTMRDLVSNVAARESVRPAVHGDSVSGEPVDLRGFSSAMAVVNSGAIAGDGDFGAVLQHSDTTTDGDFEAVPAGDLLGSFAETMDANAVEAVGYIGPRRYLRVRLVKESGTSIAASAVILLGHAHQRPVS